MIRRNKNQGKKMKIKSLAFLLLFGIFSVFTMYGQSFLSDNTMNIFKADVDKLGDVNDYGQVEIDNLFIFAGSRINAGSKGIKGGFAINPGNLYLGFLYDGIFWDGSNTKTGTIKNSNFTFDNRFSVMIGKESFGGIGVYLGFEDFYTSRTATTANKSGIFGIGAVWGKNFGIKEGVLKPELGFTLGINRKKNEVISGGTTTISGREASYLALDLSAEYLLPKNDIQQTTFNFGYMPLFYFPYEISKGPPKESGTGAFYNTLHGDIKQVYDISENFSLGFMAGASIALNFPSDDKDYGAFEFGVLPRFSAALNYKIHEKFSFNSGFRLGAKEPGILMGLVSPGSLNNQFGIYFTNINNKISNVKSNSWRFLPFTGDWGIGMLWQPEKFLSADFLISSHLNTSGSQGVNFNVLFTLNLGSYKTKVSKSPMPDFWDYDDEDNDIPLD